jgi:hypothetical protein
MRTSILASRIGDYDAADFCDVVPYFLMINTYG